MTRSSGEIRREILIAAPQEVVFSFLVKPALMAAWIGISHQLDPQPGGIVRIEVSRGNVARGRYVEVSPPRRVVFTWGFEHPSPGMPAIPAGSTQVEIDLEPEGKGTRVRLTHRQLPRESRDRHMLGWGHYLQRLKSVSEGLESGPDPYADLSVRHG